MKNLSFWLEIVKTVLPFVFLAKGVDPAIATAATALVGDAEVAIGEKEGDKKKAAVLDGVGQVLTAKKVDPAKAAAITDLVSGGIDEGVRVVNDLHLLHNAAINQTASTTAQNLTAAPIMGSHS